MLFRAPSASICPSKVDMTPAILIIKAVYLCLEPPICIHIGLEVLQRYCQRCLVWARMAARCSTVVQSAFDSYDRSHICSERRATQPSLGISGDGIGCHAVGCHAVGCHGVWSTGCWDSNGPAKRCRRTGQSFCDLPLHQRVRWALPELGVLSRQ